MSWTVRRLDRVMLGTVIAVFAAFAIAYTRITPLGASPDELSHLHYITGISDHLRLPPADEPERQQPPLYYLLGAIVATVAYDVGGYAFGKPVRITASAAMGKIGIINVERESNLSGRFHDKGVQIISGYIRRTFAQDKPLSRSASVCFEQSYSGVDGDSASSTEIYALLSALSGVPIRQEMAVTGSVNQQGDVQPIGGVNQKIEGFYDVCRLKGLTGTQGVLIPAENVDDLMLHDDVIEAVAKGQFHIYPVATIEQGIEILTGAPAGKRNASGKFEPESVFGKADARLSEMAMTMRDFD